MLLSKEELKLQKKGIDNLSIDELKQWIQICIRNEKNVKDKKPRRSWKRSREDAEKLVVQKHTK